MGMVKLCVVTFFRNSLNVVIAEGFVFGIISSNVQLTKYGILIPE